MIKQTKEIKLKDRLACLRLYQICNLILSYKIFSDKILGLIGKMNCEIKDLKENYSELIRMYPNNLELKMNYGLVLMLFFNDYKAGGTFMSKAKDNFTAVPLNSLHLTPFKEYSGNIVFKYNIKGSISLHYLNELSRNALGYDNHNFKGINAKKVIPFVFDYVKPDFQVTQVSELNIPGSYFMFTNDKYLIPVYLKVYYECLNLKQKILLTFVKNHEFLGEALMVQKDGTIIGATRGFMAHMEWQDIEYKNVLSLLPSNPEVLEYLYQPLQYSQKITFFSYSIEISSKSLIVVLLLTNKKEISYWENIYSYNLGDDYMAGCPISYEEENSMYNPSQDPQKPSKISIYSKRLSIDYDLNTMKSKLMESEKINYGNSVENKINLFMRNIEYKNMIEKGLKLPKVFKYLSYCTVSCI